MGLTRGNVISRYLYFKVPFTLSRTECRVCWHFCMWGFSISLGDSEGILGWIHFCNLWRIACFQKGKGSEVLKCGQCSTNKSQIVCLLAYPLSSRFCHLQGVEQGRRTGLQRAGASTAPSSLEQDGSFLPSEVSLKTENLKGLWTMLLDGMSCPGLVAS